LLCAVAFGLTAARLPPQGGIGESPLSTRATDAAALVRRDPQAGLTAALELVADADTFGTDFERSRAHAALGTAYFAVGRMSEALDQQQLGLKYAERTGDRGQIGKRHQSIAAVLVSQGRHEEAWPHLVVARDSAEEFDDSQAKLLTYETMAIVEQARGNATEALALYHQALTLARARGDDASLQRLSYNRATLQAEQGDVRGAIDSFEAALASAPGDDYGTMFAYASLGHAYNQCDEPLIAFQYYAAGLELGEKFGDPRVVAQNALAIGWLEIGDELPDRAFGHFEAALAGFESAGDVAGETEAYVALALSELALGELDAALWYGERAWAIGCELELDHTTYQLANALGQIHAARGEHARAYEFATLLAEVERKMSDARASARYASLDVEIRKAVEREHAEHERMQTERELARSRSELNVAIAGLAALSALCAVAVRSWRAKHVVARELSERNAEISAHSRRVEELNRTLSTALAEVKQLSGLLPICSHCKAVRDDDGYWQQVEQYLAKRSPVEFSHGICPHCAEQHYAPFLKRPTSENAEPEKV
jgi:tetratricopeptide (TPR) repeat protein